MYFLIINSLLRFSFPDFRNIADTDCLIFLIQRSSQCFPQNILHRLFAILYPLFTQYTLINQPFQSCLILIRYRHGNHKSGIEGIVYFTSHLIHTAILQKRSCQFRQLFCILFVLFVKYASFGKLLLQCLYQIV